MKDRLKAVAGAPGEELEALRERVAALETQVEEGRKRLAVLEDEVQEGRQLNLRLAELTDVVQELLLPVAQRDETKVAALVEKYAEGL